MRATPVSLIGGFYADDTLPWSCQDTVNWLPVMAEVEGTLTPSKLATPPGLMPYQQIGTGPIRGMHDLEGGRFIVSGRYLYRINNQGAATQIGTIPGVGRVTMTHNQFKTGYQMLIENGQGGGGYVYDSNTQTLARITDEGYPGSISSDYLDSYLLGVEPQGRYWFHSNLADATDYNTLDRYESEASPDKIVGLAVSQFEVVVFNQRTIEFFYNAGGATGTFQNRRQSITRGCASRHSIAKLDNTLFWLGDDGVVYRLEGYSARPVSTGPMHRAFAGKNWAEAFAFTWEDRGFKVYYLTFPDGMTFGYDVVSGLWTRRESFGLNRWRLSHTVKWGDKWYGGDYQNGRTWEIKWDHNLEGSRPIIGRRISGYVQDAQSNVVIPNAELIFDTGSEATPLPVLTLTGDQPNGVVGDDPGAIAYVASGGLEPYQYEIISGSLPAGRTLNQQTGQVTGTYTTSGSYAWTIRATDGEGLVASLADQSQVVVGNVTVSLVTNLPPAGPVGTISWSPDDQYLAISTSASPYLWVYKRVGDTFTSLTLPATGMAGRAQGLTWSPDGTTLAVAPESTVFPFVLRRTGDAFTLQTLGDQAINLQERGLVYNAAGTRLKLTYQSAIYGWSVAGGVYTATGKSADLPNSNAYTLEASDWSSDGQLFATGLSTTPWLCLWSLAGEAFVAQSLPAAVASSALQPRFAPGAGYMGWATSATPFVKLYRRNGAAYTFTEMTGLPAADATANCFEWSPTTANFAVGGNALRIYKRSGNSVTLTTTYAVGSVVGISWSPSGQYIAALRNGGTTILKAQMT
jgi:WD40 repeat protein